MCIIIDIHNISLVEEDSCHWGGGGGGGGGHSGCITYPPQ